MKHFLLAALAAICVSFNLSASTVSACTTGQSSAPGTTCTVGTLTFDILSNTLTGNPTITPLNNGMPQQGEVVAPYGIEISGSDMTGSASWDVSGAGGGIVFAAVASVDPFDNSLDGALVGDCVSLSISSGPPNFFRINSGSICSTYPNPDEITTVMSDANGPIDSYSIAYDPPTTTTPETASVWLVLCGAVLLVAIKRKVHGM